MSQEEIPIVGKSKMAATNRVKRRGLFASSGGKCFYCGTPVLNPGTPQPRDWLFVRPRISDMVREHKTPTIRGGRDEASNYVSACVGCNNAKAAFNLDEFRFVRAMQAGSFDFRFALESPATVRRDWLCCHSETHARALVVHNIPAADKAYGLRNGRARGPKARA